MIETDFPPASRKTIVVGSENQGTFWYKAAETKAPAPYCDAIIIFFVYEGFNTGAQCGILLVHIRSQATSTNISTPQFEWLVARENISLESFCVEIKDDMVELWVKNGQYGRYHFIVLAEGDRTSESPHWTLYNNPAAGTKPTAEDGYREYVSTVAKLYAPTE